MAPGELPGGTPQEPTCPQSAIWHLSGSSSVRIGTLANWPGGRVDLAKSPPQVSCSEFKLEKLLKVYDLVLPEGGTALDLGGEPRRLNPGGVVIVSLKLSPRQVIETMRTCLPLLERS